jgi:hypothetical protein
MNYIPDDYEDYQQDLNTVEREILQILIKYDVKVRLASVAIVWTALSLNLLDPPEQFYNHLDSIKKVFEKQLKERRAKEQTN